MKALALELTERRAACVVLVPFGQNRFFKTRVRAMAYAMLQRAAGCKAIIFPGV